MIRDNNNFKTVGISYYDYFFRRSAPVGLGDGLFTFTGLNSMLLATKCIPEMFPTVVLCYPEKVAYIPFTCANTIWHSIDFRSKEGAQRRNSPD
jgi:hypothetical protein